MPKKRTPLTTVKRLRETERDSARGRLADALEASDLLAEQRDGIAAEFAETLAHQKRAVATADVSVALASQRYLAVLRSQQSLVEKQQGLLRAEVEKRRLALTEADRQVRLLEKLIERREEAEALRAQRTERALLDEAASIRHTATQKTEARA